MKIWLIQFGEKLPLQPNARLLRTGQLAQHLVSQGHSVDWWASTFDHAEKKFIFSSPQTIEMAPNFRLRLLHGPGYSKNVSLERIRQHRALAKALGAWARQLPQPDLIVTAIPTIETSRAVQRFATERGIPFVVDVRDMWPDIFLEAAPKPLRGVAKCLLTPWYRDMRVIMKTASAVTSISPQFVKWALEFAKGQEPQGKHFWHSHRPHLATASEFTKGLEFWKDKGVDVNGDYILCYSGALSSKLELSTIISAAKLLKNKIPELKIVLCGRGDMADRWKEEAGENSNLIFPGWVGMNEIGALMQIAKAGLAPFAPREDFMMSIPNKVVEYLSAQLPILSSLPGYLATLIADEGCGITYAAGDVEGCVASIQWLYDHETERSQMAEKSFDLYSREFCPEKIFPEMAAYLEDVKKGYTHPIALKPFQSSVKRTFDILFSLVGCITLSPLFVLIAIVIKLESPGPVLYRGIRTGRFGRPFLISKFRSMSVAPKGSQEGTTALNDPRITAVGKVIRFTKLDELPQLWDVLVGRMSFVGPRPELERYTSLYTVEEKQILCVRPGITDFSSIAFSSLDETVGATDADKNYEKNVLPRKNELRLKYVREASLATDLSLLWLTLSVVLKKMTKSISLKRNEPIQI